jgi:nucleotide-binding universal stress UspA family protein
MTTVRRLLCATDLSPASGPAWAFARRLARATGAELTLVHVLPLVPIPLEAGFDAATYQRLAEGDRQAAERQLDELAASAPGLRVATRLVDGSPAQRILEVAAEWGADLAVVGTHGRAGLNRLLLGSVAEQVVQLARCPVVTVRSATPAPASEDPIRRIVYPTDFSLAARHAWPWARALAEATGASVDLVHVLFDVVADRHVDPAFLARAAAAIRAEAQGSADRFVAGCGLPPARVSVHLLHGVETEQIVHWAQSRAADLIVMGTHGRTGILRLALGSVARRVLHAAPCPVMTVGPETTA